MNTAHETAGTGREFTIAEGLLVLVAGLGIQFISILINMWGLYFYAPSEDMGKTIYLGLGAITAALFFGKLMDMVSDPIIGTWSDRTKSPLGKRRPFIIYGSLPLTLIFILFWLPPIHSQSTINFIWAFVTIGAYWWLFTIVLVPFLTMLPEMATTDNGRTSLGTYYAAGLFIGLAIVSTVSPIIIENYGVRVMAISFGLSALTCFQIAGWGLKERRSSRDSRTEEQQPGASTDNNDNFLKQLISTLRNRPFVIYVISAVLFNLGFNAIQPFLPFYNAQILKRSDGDMSLIFVPFLIVGLIFLPIITMLSKKINKKTIFISGMVLMAIIFASLTLISRIPSHDAKFYATLAMIGLAGIPQSVLYIFITPIIGEAIDLEKAHTGRQREALYMGVQGMIMKVGIAFALPLLTLVLSFGNTKENPTGLLLVGPVMAVISLIGALVFALYPIVDMEKERALKKGESKVFKT